jgi:radical SAM superfamily enzyme YgiQ (UPF0313 family)
MNYTNQDEQRLISPGDGWKLRVVLVSPAPYSVGMANLGIHLVYAAFNSIPGVSCHRAFAPVPAMTHRLSRTQKPVTSVESLEPLSRYHVIALSLPYENDLLNLPGMLRAAGIPLLSAERGSSFPLVIAGGVVATINPEPFAPLIDACILGEAEEIIPVLTSRLADHWVSGRDKVEALEAIGSIPGVYVPSWFETSCNGREHFTGIQHMRPEYASGMVRRYIPDLDVVPGAMIIHTPNTELKNIHLVEISRGCPGSCRFCLIPPCYGPFRWRSVQSVINQSRLAPDTWRVGLLGAGCSFHPYLSTICRELVTQHQSFSLSSLHVSGIRNDLPGYILASGARTVTFAPEAGSSDKRKAIGKNFTNDQLVYAVSQLAVHPIRTIKLYFMVGLPGETPGDLDAIIELCKHIQNTIRKINARHTSIPRLAIALSCFVPKALSAFERAPMNTEKELKTKVRYIVKQLKSVREIRITRSAPRHAVVQEFLARGDRRISNWLIRASSQGADWYHEFLRMQKNMSPGINSLHPEHPLPWDHLKIPLYCDDSETHCVNSHAIDHSKN